MRILVVGGGGREHALLHALARSARRPALVCAPGNAGTAALAENVALALDDLDGLVALGRTVDLVVVGPEGPLVAGLADRLGAAGVPVVGPSAAAARLEGSKAFANEAMARYGVPTATSRAFRPDERAPAHAYVAAHPLPVVLKADGLAAGKGVVVAETRADALDALDALFPDVPGAASDEPVLVVEAFLEGEEASLFVLTDGETYALLPAAQDHKRVGEGDTGPNTGGMGAYAPASVVTPAVLARAEAEVVRPLLDGLRAEGTPYRGVLYVGLMVDADGAPSVVEFNCRFGDPEAQTLLPLLETDAVDLFWALAHGRLADVEVHVSDRVAACVVLAAGGYPGPIATGDPVSGLDEAARHALVFHAGTARGADGRLVTAGGRVL
ncbi:MAG TPA: phosphoribosylamine--glycine ligase, partial [Rubricoccaceae bacterium]